MKKIILFYFVVFSMTILFSCRKLVEVDLPKNQLNTADVFRDSVSAKAALVNIYALIDKTIDNNTNKFLGLYTDELTFPNQPNDEAWNSNLSSSNGTVLNIWRNNYFGIYSCNQIIEQLDENNPLPRNLKLSITAEARFLRAYFYFYLVNAFGDVPLIISTNVNDSRGSSRNGTQLIYQQILSDLNEAESILSEKATLEKARANKWATKALKARIYLYQGNYKEAGRISGEIISSNLFSPLSSPSTVFSNTSKETILQIWTPTGFIADATTLIPTSGRPTYPITNTLMSSFESNDLRRSAWFRSTVVSGITYNYPYKYHNRAANTSSPEYLLIFRLAEQYLIRAESSVNQDNVAAAIADLNIIRSRAGLNSLQTTLSKEQCIEAVQREWRNEFCIESGQRFLTLKRTGKLKEVLQGLKVTWSEKSIVLPIPQNELSTNPSLIQNPGY